MSHRLKMFLSIHDTIGNWVFSVVCCRSKFIHYIYHQSHFSAYDKLRDIVETVPCSCSFTMIVECCRSGAFIEGVFEIIGHNTRRFVSDRSRAPRSRFLQQQLNSPSGRPLVYSSVLVMNLQLLMRLQATLAPTLYIFLWLSYREKIFTFQILIW
jgi:hypothetical protein